MRVLSLMVYRRRYTVIERVQNGRPCSLPARRPTIFSTFSSLYMHTVIEILVSRSYSAPGRDGAGPLIIKGPGCREAQAEGARPRYTEKVASKLPSRIDPRLGRANRSNTASSNMPLGRERRIRSLRLARRTSCKVAGPSSLDVPSPPTYPNPGRFGSGVGLIFTT